jgi:hypothetical protein
MSFAYDNDSAVTAFEPELKNALQPWAAGIAMGVRPPATSRSVHVTGVATRYFINAGIGGYTAATWPTSQGVRTSGMGSGMTHIAATWPTFHGSQTGGTGDGTIYTAVLGRSVRGSEMISGAVAHSSVIGRVTEGFEITLGFLECPNAFLVSGSSIPSITSLTAIDAITCVSSGYDLDIPVSVEGRLVGYEAYARPDWDGYEAEPIMPETTRAAERFLSMLPNSLGEPDVTPGADGTIGLEWSFTDRSLRKLFIDIGPGAVWGGYWRRVTGEKQIIPAAPIDAHTKRALKELFEKLSA